MQIIFSYFCVQYFILFLFTTQVQFVLLHIAFRNQ